MGDFCERSKLSPGKSDSDREIRPESFPGRGFKLTGKMTGTGTRRGTNPRLCAQPKARNHPSRKEKSNPYSKIPAITELRQSEQIEEAVIHAKREIQDRRTEHRQ
jgi:hypothetical protein